MLSGIESFLVEKYGIETLKSVSRKLLYEGKCRKLTNTCSFWFCLLQLNFIGRLCVILMNFY